VSNGRFIAPIVALFIVAGIVALSMSVIGPLAGWSDDLVKLAMAAVILTPFALLLFKAPKGD
jgi:hypothetical protein